MLTTTAITTTGTPMKQTTITLAMRIPRPDHTTEALVELGDGAYHAEVLHDEDAGTITIYVLNGAATAQLPIESTEITVNVKHDGQPRQYHLAAEPDSGDPAGKSSRFVSSQGELTEHLHETDAEPRLVLTIEGKSFRGIIAHDHDGGNHDHE